MREGKEVKGDRASINEKEIFFGKFNFGSQEKQHGGCEVIDKVKI